MSFKVLIVCSGNKENFDFQYHQPFVFEQIESIKHNFGIEYFVYAIQGGSKLSYFNSYFEIKRMIKEKDIDIIHGHFGLTSISYLFINKPKLVTFHGSDINKVINNLICSITGLFLDSYIYVSSKLKNKHIINNENKANIIPCGIDLDNFFHIKKEDARVKLGLDLNKKYALFSSSFNNGVKNFPLAKKSVGNYNKQVNGNPKLEIVELTGYSRKEVNLLLNAVDLLLMTSYSEGSPQIIKEAMACGTPIISTDVGEVDEIIGNTKGTWLSNFDSKDISRKIEKALLFDNKTNGRKHIERYDNNAIAYQVYKIYKEVQSK